MRERLQHLAVGLTALTGLGSLCFIVVLFGYAVPWLEAGYRVQVELPNAQGLNDSSRVRMSGIDIGKVGSVRLAEPPERGVRATIVVDPDVRIPREARVTVSGPLIGGNAFMAIDVSELSPPQMAESVPIDGTGRLEGQATSLVDALTGELRELIGEPLNRLDVLIENFDQLSGTWTRLGENLNQLVEVRSVERVDRGEARANLSTLLERADRRMTEFETLIRHADRTFQQANGLIGDEQFQGDVKAAASEARKLTGKLNDQTDRLARRVVALADDVSEVVGLLRDAAERANTKEGTVGKLLNDPQLYDNLNDAAERLRLMLDEAELLIEKWKAEGVPVQF